MQLAKVCVELNQVYVLHVAKMYVELNQVCALQVAKVCVVLNLVYVLQVAKVCVVLNLVYVLQVAMMCVALNLVYVLQVAKVCVVLNLVYVLQVAKVCVVLNLVYVLQVAKVYVAEPGVCIFCWLLLYSAVLSSWADSLRSHVILHEWLTFHSLFLSIHQSGVLTVLTWLVPCETAAVLAHTVYTIEPCTMSLHAKPQM